MLNYDRPHFGHTGGEECSEIHRLNALDWQCLPDDELRGGGHVSEPSVLLFNEKCLARVVVPLIVLCQTASSPSQAYNSFLSIISSPIPLVVRVPQGKYLEWFCTDRLDDDIGDRDSLSPSRVLSVEHVVLVLVKLCTDVPYTPWVHIQPLLLLRPFIDSDSLTTYVHHDHVHHHASIIVVNRSYP